MTQPTQLITLAGGCFWCIEGAFKSVKGIISAQSGYMGGNAHDATYNLVCSGTTEHAEVVQLSFESDSISTKEILEIFFFLHDPTQLNRQGYDIGRQYRSAVFYHNEAQKRVTSAMIEAIDKEQIWPNPVVTEVVQHKPFYPADASHENYYQNNTEKQYCQVVISPKLAKFKETFANKLK